jgi:AbrB family looped-hinge helix DNA binding protein
MEMINMLSELRAKSQITIPKELVDKLGLSEGDKLEIYERDGIICIIPVVVYPKKFIDELRDEIETTKLKIKYGEQPLFDNVDALFEKLEEK